jgi:hypothetical protein
MHGRLALAGLCALFLLLPAATALAAPVNDAFDQARRLPLGTPDATITNATATTEPGEAFTSTAAPSGALCKAPEGDSQAGATVWWWVLGTGRPLTVTTVGSDFDTHLGIFPGAITGDGALCQDADVNGESITIPSEPGRAYRIQVGGCAMNPLGCDAPVGQIQVLATSPATPNDSRAAAAALVTGPALRGDNYAATEELGEQTRCQGRDYGRTVWYRWTASGPGAVTFRVSGAPNATVAAFPQSGSSSFGCDAEPGGDAQLRVNVRQAGDVLVQVAGIGAHAGLASHSAQSTFAVSAEFDPSDDPRTGAGRERVPARAQMAVRLNGRYTKIRRLTARNVPARARLQVRCSGRGCPFARSRTRMVRRASKEVSLSSAKLRRANMRPGTRLEVRVARAGFVGVVTRWTFRARRPPLEETRCLPPGERRPRQCE